MDLTTRHSKRPLLVLIASCLISWACGVVQTTDLRAADFKAGAAIADITPQKWPVNLVGSFTERLADKAWDPLAARAIALDDGKTRLAIVVVDNCLVDRKYFDEAKRQIAADSGIPANRVLCAATHTHSAPPGKDRLNTLGYATTKAYRERMIGGIVTAVRRAVARLQPAEMGHGVVAVPEEVFNRRWFMKLGGIPVNPFGDPNDLVRMNPPRGGKLLDRPAGPVDPDVNFLSFRRRDGRPIALLANYSLHYVGGIPSGGVSADYFGEFARLVETSLGARIGAPSPVAILSNGTSGDVNNLSFRKPRPRAKPFERMRAVARLVADRVLEKNKQLKYRRDVDLAMSQQLLTLDRRIPPPELVAWAKKTLDKPESARGNRLAPYYARRTLALAEGPKTSELVLQALRIGDIGIAAIPCEVFCEIGLNIKAKSALKKSFTIELANGHYGYLPTPRQHRWGGYETWLGTCVLEKTASEKIEAVIFKLLKEVAQKASQDAVRSP